MAAVSEELIDKLPRVTEVVKSAGDYLLNRFRKIRETVKCDDARNIRIDADLTAETMVLGVISDLFPDDSTYGEGSSLRLHNPRRIWFVDALEGTTNFILGVPLFVTQCAYVIDGEIHAAIIYVPPTNECFMAVFGRGANCNGTRLQVAEPPNIDPRKAIVVLPRAAHSEEIARHAEIYSWVVKTVRTVRVWNSAAGEFVRVAQGREDGQGCVHASIHNGVSLYDILPGILLVREAGGLVTDFVGNEIRLPCTNDKESVDRLFDIRTDILCAAPRLHKILLQSLALFFPLDSLEAP